MANQVVRALPGHFGDRVGHLAVSQNLVECSYVGSVAVQSMAELPFFKEGQFLRAKDLNDLVENVRSLRLEIASLRKEIGDLPRGAPLPVLDFSPKVIYFSGDQQFLQYPWSVSCKSGLKDLKEYDVIPNDQCELEVIDPSGVPCVEIRDDSLVPLRIGRSMLKVTVPFQTKDSVFTIEVRQP